MAIKFPPPPPTAIKDPQLNRWLLELQSILSNTGGIDPAEVTGLSETIAQVATNTTDIASLQGTTGGNTGAITTLQGQVTAIDGEIATINGQITTLSSRAQVFSGTGGPNAGLGNVGDWYANIGPPIGAAGARIFVKTGAGWIAFPF